ncbi:hypothetical protein MRB53_041198 [Persea americana]|nr:hypothetical protein MRB53_041198 [Persea americana]
MEAKRQITVLIDASLTKPEAAGIKYVRSQAASEQKDLIAGSDWGTGDTVYLKFAVKDTGRGLNESEMDLLFRRFSQATPKTHVTYGGSGLGLFISRELTEKQGGEIGVASESGKGSTFAFYVKSRRADPPAATEEATRDSPVTELDGLTDGGTTPLNIPMSPTQSVPATSVPPALTSLDKNKPPLAAKTNRFPVLVVEDNLVNRRVLVKQLQKHGFSCYEANHGLEALDLLRASTWQTNPISLATLSAAPSSIAALSTSPLAASSTMSSIGSKKFSDKDGPLEIAVILMDLEMPICDGLTCMKRIRNMENDGTIQGHVPIIAVSANARKEQIEEAKQAGADSAVSKPFRVPELIKEMESLVAAAS